MFEDLKKIRVLQNFKNKIQYKNDHKIKFYKTILKVFKLYIGLHSNFNRGSMMSIKTLKTSPFLIIIVIIWILTKKNIIFCFKLPK